jgi:hypothetical protein
VVQKTGNSPSAQNWSLPTWLANLSFSPDGSQLAGADLANFSIYFLNVATGDVVHKLEWLDSVTPALYGVQLSPDWRYAAWVSQNVIQIMAVEMVRTDSYSYIKMP